MDIDQIKTFLAVAAHGSFLEAAERVHVTQSTVSARIQNLEQGLGARLFVRNRSGASLTPAGQRFLRHAKTLLLTFEQACHDVGLPSRFRASLTIGARIALWDAFLPRWAGRMRAAAPDISLNTEIGFEEDLMRRIIDGTMDLALMYSPQQGAGIQVEHLFDETLILVGGEPDRSPAGRRLCLCGLGADLLRPAPQGLSRPGAAGADRQHRLARPAVDPRQRRHLLRPRAGRRRAICAAAVCSGSRGRRP